MNNLVEVTIFGIAYSEHSSFSELQQCVRDFKPFIIKPTVNAYTKSAEEQMLLLLGSWSICDFSVYNIITTRNIIYIITQLNKVCVF